MIIVLDHPSHHFLARNKKEEEKRQIHLSVPCFRVLRSASKPLIHTKYKCSSSALRVSSMMESCSYFAARESCARCIGVSLAQLEA